MSTRRLFTEKEISVVLKRAAELQRTEGPTDPSGLSLNELQQIATEAGIDPAYVQTAIAELNQGGPPEEGFSFWGGPLTLEEEHIVDGEATEEDWELMVGEIRHMYNGIGEHSRLGRTFEWTWKAPSGLPMQVTATPRDGQTRIRIYKKMDSVAGGIYAGLGSLAIPFGIILPVVLDVFPALEALASITVVVSMFFLCRWMFSSYVRNEQRKARSLMAKLDPLVTGVGTLAAAAPTPIAATPRLALDHDHPNQDPAAPTTKSRTSA